MTDMNDIENHLDYKRRVETQERSLRALSHREGEYKMIQYAAESYAYWSLRAILAEKQYTDLVLLESKTFVPLLIQCQQEFQRLTESINTHLSYKELIRKINQALK